MKTKTRFKLDISSKTLNEIEQAYQESKMVNYDCAKAIMKSLSFTADGTDAEKEEEYYQWWKDSIYREVLPLHPDIFYSN